MGDKFGEFLTHLCIFGNILTNMSIIVASVVECTQIFAIYFNAPKIVFKLLIILLYLTLQALISTPEKIKPYSYLSAGITIIIGKKIDFHFLVFMMFWCNVWIVIPQNRPSNITVDMFTLAGTGLFCSTGTYAFEGAGTIFTIRESMKTKRDITKLLRAVFSFMACIFIGFSMSLYFAFGNEKISSITFSLYDSQNWPIMHLSGGIFCAILLVFTPLYNISNGQYLENYKFVQNWIFDKNGNKIRSKETLFRWGLLLITTFPALLTD